jgi:dynein heavy chain
MSIYPLNPSSDFDVCENVLAVLLDEYDDVPWDALKYLIAEANYGGRITDDWDRRVCRSYINGLFHVDAITTSQYRVSTMSSYYVPDSTDLQFVREYAQALPQIDKAEVFGQHPNADIASQIKESAGLLNSLLSLQPTVTSGGKGASREDKVLAIVIDLSRRLPEDMDIDYTKRLCKHDVTPLNVVLLQEMARYNILLGSIRKSLEDLQNGIKGIVLMSPELEETFSYIFEGKVPPLWSKAYFSLKPLAAWTRDLVQRIELFAEWGKGYEYLSANY